MVRRRMHLCTIVSHAAYRSLYAKAFFAIGVKPKPTGVTTPRNLPTPAIYVFESLYATTCYFVIFAKATGVKSVHRQT